MIMAAGLLADNSYNNIIRIDSLYIRGFLTDKSPSFPATTRL